MAVGWVMLLVAAVVLADRLDECSCLINGGHAFELQARLLRAGACVIA